MKFTTLALALITQAVAISAVKDCSKTDEWDVIVVGSGLSGSIIAAKLATESPEKCVLVVEGGKDSGQILDHKDADLETSFNNFFENGWGTVHESETLFNTPGTYANNSRLICYGTDCDYVWGNDGSGTPWGLVAGKLVGGSGALNGALMQYPDDRNFDSYPDGWKADDMKEYLVEIERTMKPSSTPSTDGKHYNDERGAIQLREAMEAVGFEYSDDGAYMKPQANHMGIPNVTTRNGRRASSTSVYLKPALNSLSNIHLWNQTEVTEIVLDESTKKAKSLKVSITGKKFSFINLAEDGLLVVSGGGVKTPQVLLDSGIGPGLKVPNDYVGKRLTDKTIGWIYLDAPKDANITGYNFGSPPVDDQQRFIEEGAGPLTQFGPLRVGFIDPKLPEDPDGTYNMVEFFLGATEEHDKVRVDFVHMTPKMVGEGGTIFPGGGIDRNGKWDNGYSVKSSRAAADVVQKAMEKFGYVRKDNNFAGIHAMNHPAGTCALDKCIDAKTLLVKGLQNVAVCDHSIVPGQAIVHSAFALMALALKGADILKDFRKATAQNDEL